MFIEIFRYGTGCLVGSGHVLSATVGALCLLMTASSLAAQSQPWVQETTAAQWTVRGDHATVVFNNRMWVMGGHGPGNSSSDRLNDVWSSADGITWTQETAAAQWSSRSGHGTVVFNNRMWVIGGLGANYLNDVWSSVDGVNWTLETAAAPWLGRSFHEAVVFNNRMWVLGGNTNLPARNLNDVWSSPDGVNWTLETPGAQWSPRRWYAAVVFNNRMWVLGGDGGGNYYSGSAYNNDVWSSADGVNWTLEVAPAQWWARRAHTAAVFNNRMWVMGGHSVILDTFNDVWSSADGITWTQEAAAAQWSARARHTTVVFDNRMWVMGGASSLSNTSAICYKDVWSWTPAPQITSTPPAAAVVGQHYTYTVTASGFPAPSFSVSGLPSWLSFDNVDTISGTPTAVDIGLTGTITVTATNAHGVDDQNLQIDVLGVAPLITSPTPAADAVAGILYSHTFTATGEPAPVFSARGLPPWLSLDAHTGELSGTPALADYGTNANITVTASNGWLPDDDQSFTINVVGATPRITSTPPITAIAGLSYSYTVQATGEPAPAFSANTLPSWLTFNGSVLSGTPTGTDVGLTGSIEITASNGHAPDDVQTFQIDVTAVPAITSTPKLAAVPGRTYSYAVTATGSPLPTLSVASTLPAWLSFNPSTGVLSGTPTNNAASTSVNVVIVASNVVGDDTQTFTVEVTRVPGAEVDGSKSGDGCVASADAMGLRAWFLLLALPLLAALGRRRRVNAAGI